MFKNYFKLAFRHLLKNKAFSLINIIGLAIGLACSFLIFLHVFTELSYDRHFENADDIYRMAVKSKMGDNEFEAAVTGGPLAKILMDELPEVSGYTRLREGRMTLLSSGENAFYEENILYADSTFFEIFSYEIVAGDHHKPLTHPYSVVLTEKFATKFFGDENPIGKEIKWNNDQIYIVTAVIKDQVEKSHLNFDILVSFSTFYQNERFRNLLESLFAYMSLSYLQVHPDTDMEDLEMKIAGVVDKHMGERLASYGGKYEVFLQHITSIYLHSDLLHEMRASSDVSLVYIFTAVAILILIVACINFTNLSTAKSSKRSLEVGVRKVFGADRGGLFRQFISESVLIVLISFILAIILFNLALPGFNELSGNNFTSDILLNGNYVIFLLAVILFVGFISGSYPALFLSRFKPISVLKGVFFSGSRRPVFRNIMVIVQFVISIFLIAGTLLIYQQLSYIQNRNLGIDKDNIAVIAMRDRSMLQGYKSLKAEMQNIPGVLDVTGSSAYLGNFQQRMGFFPEGGGINDMVLTLNMQVDQNYLEMLNANIALGRNFFENSIADSNAIIINRSYANDLGWENPIGKHIYIPGDENVPDYPLKIVGMVDDFNYASLHEEVKPLIIMNNPDRVRYLSIKINPKDQQQVLALIGEKWEELYPDYPFEYFLQKTQYDNMYRSEVNMGRLFIYFTLLAIFIAALGLFGLSSFTAEQRTKEIGIRKVLGSSVSQILVLISKEFSRLVLIAIVLAIPISWFGMDKWLQNFAFQTNISWWIFIVSGIAAILITYLTITLQAYKASKSNPVDALKYE